MQDRLCGGVQVPDAPVIFPSLALSVLDADIARLQSSMSATASGQLNVPGLSDSFVTPSHVCHACARAGLVAAAPSSITGTDTRAQPASCATKTPKQIGNATPATPLCAIAHGCSLPRTDACPGKATGQRDTGKQARSHHQVCSTVAATLSDPVSSCCHAKETPQRDQTLRRGSVDGQNKERASAENTATMFQTFVVDHAGGVFDIMKWYIQSRSQALPPYLPPCPPFSATPSDKPPIQMSKQHRPVSSGQVGGSKMGRSQVQQLGWKQQMAGGCPHADPGDKVRPNERSIQCHKHSNSTSIAASRCACVVDISGYVLQREHCTAFFEAVSTVTDTKHRLRKAHKGARGQGSSKAGARAVQQGAVRKQGGKKRGGRMARELAATDAANRDGMVELGFNAHLKQFEKSQREKGVFKNRQKARPSVYTVSGVPQNP